MRNDTYSRDFWNVMRGMNVTGDMPEDGNGGYTAPEEFVSDFNAALERENLFRRYATVIDMSAPDGKIQAVASTGSASWVNDGALYPESADSFTQFPLTSHKLAALTRLRESFIKDNAFDLEKYLRNEFARRFGRAEESACLTGNGTDTPCGLLHATGGAQVGVTTSANTITCDEIRALYFSLKPEHRKNAVWLMNDNTAMALRTLKDNSGSYLWRDSDDSIFSKPVVIANAMPDMSSGAKAIAFGDLSYYWLVIRQSLTAKVLTELYSTQGQIGIVAYERLDGRLILPEAVKALQMAE